MKTEQLLSIAKNALEDKKAKDIKVLDLRNISSFTDFMIVASGNTDRHVTALAQHVVEQAKAHKFRPLGEEGTNAGEWVLIDLGDVVVHIMQPETRDFYQLEKLWQEIGGDSRLNQLRG